MKIFQKKEDTDFLGLLVQATKNVVEASKYFREAMNGNDKPASYLAKMEEMESKGDGITHHIFTGLNQVFITPLDREDIMALAVKVDDVLDGIEATLARFEYLNVDFTDKYMQDFAEVLVSSCEHMHESFQLLAKKKYAEIREHTVQINKLENEGDGLMRKGIREIFTHPKDPYHDFKLKEIYERLEETTDCCEDVADILESVVLRYG